MLGILEVFDANEEPNLDALLKTSKEIADPNLTDLVKEVSVKEPVKYNVDGKKTVVLMIAEPNTALSATCLNEA